jgi:hypothetical protein
LFPRRCNRDGSYRQGSQRRIAGYALTNRGVVCDRIDYPLHCRDDANSKCKR